MKQATARLDEAATTQLVGAAVGGIIHQLVRLPLGKTKNIMCGRSLPAKAAHMCLKTPRHPEAALPLPGEQNARLTVVKHGTFAAFL